MKNATWLILSFSLPTKSQAIRVKVWRRLQTIGAVQVKNSLYVLPATAGNSEHFTWLAKEVEEADGEALFFETETILTMDDAAIMRLFTQERDAEYATLDAELHETLTQARGKEGVSLDRELLSTRRKLTRRYEAIHERDYFPSGKGARTAALLSQLTALLDGGADAAENIGIKTFPREAFAGKIWITRERPYVDRLASFWLVRRFLDPQARLAFVPPDAHIPKREDAVRFDMTDAEFTHVGGRTTFEVMITAFSLEQDVPAGLVAAIRAIDLEEMDTAPTESRGIKRILDGLLLSINDDEQLVESALVLMDALSASYQKTKGEKS